MAANNAIITQAVCLVVRMHQTFRISEDDKRGDGIVNRPER